MEYIDIKVDGVPAKGYIFDETTGSMTPSILTIPDKYNFGSAAARDLYMTEHPTEFQTIQDNYTDKGVLTPIRLLDTDEIQVWQNGAWEDAKFFIQDGTAQIDLNAIPDNHIVAKNGATNTFKDSGILIDTNGVPYFTNDPVVKAGSIQFGDGGKLGMAGANPKVTSLSTGNTYLVNMVRTDKQGNTYKPFYAPTVSGESDVVIQGTEDQTLSASNYQMNYTFTENSQVNALKVKVASDVTNLRFKVLSSESGTPQVVFTYPDKVSYDQNKGVSLATGDHTIDLYDSPLRELKNIQIAIDVTWDTGTIKGATSFPYVVATVQKFELKPLADEAHVAGEIRTDQEIKDIIGSTIKNNGNMGITYDGTNVKLASFTNDPAVRTIVSDMISAGEGIETDMSGDSLIISSRPDVEYLESASAVTFNTEKEYTIVRYQGTTTITQPLPLTNGYTNGAQLFVENFGDSPVILEAPANTTVVGGTTYEVPNGGWAVLLVDKDTSSYQLAAYFNEEKGIPPSNYYVETSDPTVFPTDKTIMVARFTGTVTSITQPMPNVLDVQDGTLLFVDNVSTNVSHTVFLDGFGSQGVGGVPTYNLVQGHVALFIANKDDATWDNVFDVGDFDGVTISSEDGTIERVAKLNLQYPLEYQQTGTPDLLNINVNPAAYEPQHPPAYLAYIADDEEVLGRPNQTVKSGVIWFDDVIKPAGAYIQIDRVNKAIGLQDYTLDDPNITGGTAYLIGVRMGFRGVAPSDGEVTLKLIDKTTKQILEDINGEPMGVTKAYKTGDAIGVLEFFTIKKFAGIQEFQVVIEDPFTDDTLVLEDRTEGASGIVIQALGKEYKTSTALLQFESDINYGIKWSSHYLGDYFKTLDFLIQEDIAESEGGAGEGQTLNDGWHLHNPEPLKASVVDKTLILKDNGVDITYFNFGNIVSAEQTKMLKGKNLEVKLNISNIDNGYNVYLAKWTGTPDAYTSEIITGIVNDVPTVQANWELLQEWFISENALGTYQELTHQFIVPTDANNFAIIIVPVAAQSPTSLKLKEFTINVVNPFTGYVIDQPLIKGEEYLRFAKDYMEVGTLCPTWAASYRFTINDAMTPMPTFDIIKGDAPITIVDKPADPNSASEQGRLKFTADGEATMSTTLRVHSGESLPTGTDANLVIYWAKANGAIGDYTEIPDSRLEYALAKSDKFVEVTLPKFTYEATNGDELVLLASSGGTDYAYIQSSSRSIPLTSTVINFKTVATEDPSASGRSVGQWALDGITQITIATGGTPVKLQGVDTGDQYNIDFVTSSGLTYTGATPKTFLFTGTSDVESSDQGAIQYIMYLNGSPIANGITPHDFSVQSKVENLSITKVIQLNPNDVIEVYVNHESTNAVLSLSTFTVALVEV